jgi:hypothetical protein
MEQEANSEPPNPRSLAEIFADLSALAQSDGALHEISAIIYRDWVITFDTQEGRIADDPEHRWSTSKLNKNELMLLIGLAIQSHSDRIYSIELAESNFVNRADRLLGELRDRIAKDCAPVFEKGSMTLVERPEAIGLVAREAIYYGADSFYLHQFLGFSRHRYREDGTWLLQNVGLSIRPMIEIAKFLVDRINNQMTAVGQMRKAGQTFTNGGLTNSLLIAKADVESKFGHKANAFLARFSIPATNANTKFVNPFTINQVAITPLIDLGDHLYVPNQYRLFEAVYESPFYWMMADKAYNDTAAAHRGAFLERTAARIFGSVFGKDYVYANAVIRDGSKDIAGEVDALVVYGEFVLIAQAKSKRVTLKARAGDTEALKVDFKGAIQDPYRQAMGCAALIRKGANCFTQDGAAIDFPSLPRIFPVVILSDPFPASTHLSAEMLEYDNDIAPVIWDLGVLDCVARLLPTPIEMIFYLKCRSEVFGKVLSDSEYNFLGYHIRTKLALSDEFDMMVLDRDFATIVDNYMVAGDLGVETERPLGILERLQIPVISDLLAELKTADPRLASVVVDVYSFSGGALKELSATILAVRQEIRVTGKAIKAISIPTDSGGITYAVARKHDANAARAAEAIGAKHKYDAKRDRWYVILDIIETDNPVDGLLPLIWPWKEDEAEAERSEQVAKLFKSSQQIRKAPTATARGLRKSYRREPGQITT